MILDGLYLYIDTYICTPERVNQEIISGKMHVIMLFSQQEGGGPACIIPCRRARLIPEL